ncbi:lipoprotein insertase outer membrane protein LolB [Cupriavidus gilardii]|uniref:lipoprotein insertase outer membrane protein LolB n=1 Tax=Cupriavidus gilardii TaxID=82541 RepID=UPI0021BF76FB|nr:lipoprotein insertase outer membrane protein LolB [Cupriavidus gilardii]MCT9125089.1 lipoprotein insertase outer membrane protein LolB [Cupriavidus gilardii]
MDRSRRTLTLLCLSAPLWLAACASVTASRQFDAAAGARASELTGRFAANYVRYGRDEGVQGSFHWREQGDNVRLDLISPLGQTLAVVTATPSGATLDLPNEPPRNAPQVDALLEQSLGFALPVAGMRDWLRARPAPGAPASATRDAQGRLETLSQNGWTVRYAAWQPAPDGAETLPRRIDLARDGAGGPMSVKLVIDAPVSR